MTWNPEIGPGSIVTVITGICLFFAAWYALKSQIAVIVSEAALRHVSNTERFQAVNARVDKVDAKIDKVDTKIDLASTTLSKLAVQDERMNNIDRQIEEIKEGLRLQIWKPLLEASASRVGEKHTDHRKID